MAEAAVRGPHGQSEAVVKYGKTSTGTARFRCQQTAQGGRTCLRSYAYPGCLPAVKQPIVDMTLNGNGSRDSTRVLQVGPNTVIKELKTSDRPLPGQHQRSGRVLSGRGDRRSSPRGSRGLSGTGVDNRSTRRT